MLRPTPKVKLKAVRLVEELRNKSTGKDTVTAMRIVESLWKRFSEEFRASGILIITPGSETGNGCFLAYVRENFNQPGGDEDE